MSVKELIERLQKLPQDSTIVICNNDYLHDIETEIDGFEIFDLGLKSELQKEYNMSFDEGYNLVSDNEFVFIIQGSD